MNWLLYTFAGAVFFAFIIYLIIRNGGIGDDDRCDITQADERPDIFGAPGGTGGYRGQ